MPPPATEFSPAGSSTCQNSGRSMSGSSVQCSLLLRMYPRVVPYFEALYVFRANDRLTIWGTYTIKHVKNVGGSSLILIGRQFHGRASFQRSLGRLRPRQHGRPGPRCFKSSHSPDSELSETTSLRTRSPGRKPLAQAWMLAWPTYSKATRSSSGGLIDSDARCTIWSS